MRCPLFLYLFLLVCLPLQAQLPSPPKREVRAVWLTTLNGLDWPTTRATSEASRRQQQEELCHILDLLKAANFNTIMLQTRVRGSVIYPSAIEPWDGALTGTIGQNPGYDPLRFAIEETHRRGMELHAWVVTIPCFKVAIARQMGSKSILRTRPTLCKRIGDTYYLDPGQPGTADYLADICMEIVENYDVDGLHFDYIRYPENAASFSDAATYKKYAPKGMAKAAWRRENITRIVRHIYNKVHARKPWVRISSSPVGKHADLSRYSSRGWNARDAVHQDAQLWLRKGFHDLLFPMMYFDGDHFYPFAADWQEQSAGRHVVPGLGVYMLHPRERNWPLSAIQRQLHFLRAEGLAGECYFRSRFLTDNVKGIYDYLHSVFYAFPALPPACTWLDSIPPQTPTPPGRPQQRTARRGGGILTWQPSTDNLPGGVRYNVYASTEWPVDTSQPQNLVATLLPEPRFEYNPLYVALMGLHFAVTAIDRCGNESAPLQFTTTAPSVSKTSPRTLHRGPSGQLEFGVSRGEHGRRW
ncbi:MAG: family 10 glycosylhydrolase [Bacteroidaceae bacterium]|nr:family 10 glycosylhydrolase [Bacteroidaceae bacterium]